MLGRLDRDRGWDDRDRDRGRGRLGHQGCQGCGQDCYLDLDLDLGLNLRLK